MIVTAPACPLRKLGLKFQTYGEWIATEPGYRPLSVPHYDGGRAKEQRTVIEDAMNRAIVPVMVAAPPGAALLGAATSVAHGQQAFNTFDDAASAGRAAKASDMKALMTVPNPTARTLCRETRSDAATREVRRCVRRKASDRHGG
jgi:hypothetical protein